jgi:hypothetical protein
MHFLHNSKMLMFVVLAHLVFCESETGLLFICLTFALERVSLFGLFA